MSDTLGTGDAFDRLNAPIFLARATQSAGGQIITLHTTERRRLSIIAARAAALLKDHGVDAKLNVVSHSAHALRSARSLERLSARFGSGEILYDPTGFVARSESIVACAKSVRADLGALALNIYLDVNRRTLYVIVREHAEGDAIAARADLVRRVGQVVRHWQATSAPGFALAVRIGTHAPRDTHLISVDRLSEKRAFYSFAFERKQFTRGALAMGVAAVFGASLAVPAAAREPAVSTPNITLTTKVGTVDDETDADFGAKVALPFGESFGAQAEVGAGSNDYYGVGGHVFWRDPSIGLVGVFGSVETSNQVDMNRWGVEGELYLNRFTVGGRVGGQSGDVDDGVFGRVDVTFYATPDLALRAGGEFSPEVNLGRGEIEWHPAVAALPQLSVFADGEFGDDDRDSVMGGIRLHFGEPGGTLMDRDRKEDPWWLIWNRAAIVAEHHASYGGPPAQHLAK